MDVYVATNLPRPKLPLAHTIAKSFINGINQNTHTLTHTLGIPPPIPLHTHTHAHTHTYTHTHTHTHAHTRTHTHHAICTEKNMPDRGRR